MPKLPAIRELIYGEQIKWSIVSKGTSNAQVSLRISRQSRQQKIHIFASCNPSFSQLMTLKNETLQLNIYCETHFYPYNIFLII